MVRALVYACIVIPACAPWVPSTTEHHGRRLFSVDTAPSVYAGKVDGKGGNPSSVAVAATLAATGLGGKGVRGPAAPSAGGCFRWQCGGQPGITHGAAAKLRRSPVDNHIECEDAGFGKGCKWYDSRALCIAATEPNGTATVFDCAHDHINGYKYMTTANNYCYDHRDDIPKCAGICADAASSGLPNIMCGPASKRYCTHNVIGLAYARNCPKTCGKCNVTAAPSAVPAAIHTGGQGKGGRQGARTSAPPTIDYYASGKGSVHVQITAGKGSAHVDTAGKGSAHTNTSTVGGKGSAHTSDSTVGGQGSVHTSAPTTAPTTGCVDNSHSGLKNHGVYQSCARAVGALSCDHAKYGAKLKLYCPKTCGACAGAPLPTRGNTAGGNTAADQAIQGCYRVEKGHISNTTGAFTPETGQLSDGGVVGSVPLGASAPSNGIFCPGMTGSPTATPTAPLLCPSAGDILSHAAHLGNCSDTLQKGQICYMAGAAGFQCNASRCRGKDSLQPGTCSSVCPWTSPTEVKDQFLCKNGESCTGALCCNLRCGRLKCPRNFPHMCASPTSGADGYDHGCNTDCDMYGGRLPCVAAPKEVLRKECRDTAGTLGAGILRGQTCASVKRYCHLEAFKVALAKDCPQTCEIKCKCLVRGPTNVPTTTPTAPTTDAPTGTVWERGKGAVVLGGKGTGGILNYASGAILSAAPTAKPTSSAAPTAKCADNSEAECAPWAASGECERNPVYMEAHCCLSCSTMRAINGGKGGPATPRGDITGGKGTRAHTLYSNPFTNGKGAKSAVSLTTTMTPTMAPTHSNGGGKGGKGPTPIRPSGKGGTYTGAI